MTNLTDTAASLTHNHQKLFPFLKKISRILWCMYYQTQLK